METIWIIGAGKFGLRAARWLLRQNNPQCITMVDQDNASLERAQALGCRIIHFNAIEFLCDRLTRNRQPDWIVPAVPVHLAWEWCRMTLESPKVTPFVLPDQLRFFLPNPMDGASGDIYVSHADFICPDNCNEPDNRCTKTGKPRKKDMFKLLAEINVDGIRPFVVQSLQLGPGVGGYRPCALFDLQDAISRYRGRFFAATACRCHGVISPGQRA